MVEMRDKTDANASSQQIGLGRMGSTFDNEITQGLTGVLYPPYD